MGSAAVTDRKHTCCVGVDDHYADSERRVESLLGGADRTIWTGSSSDFIDLRDLSQNIRSARGLEFWDILPHCHRAPKTPDIKSNVVIDNERCRHVLP